MWWWFEMSVSDAVQQHRMAIRRIVEQHGARNPRAFGAARGQDVDSAYLGLVVDLIDGATALASEASIKLELEALTGIEIDVVTPLDLPEHCLRAVLAGAVPV